MPPQTTVMIEVQKQLAALSAVGARLEETVTKAVDLQKSLATAQAVTSTRVDAIERLAATLAELVEKRREETIVDIKTLHERVDRVERDLSNDIRVLGRDITDALSSLKADLDAQHGDVTRRLTSLERWKWTIVGGTGVVAFVASQFVPFLPSII